jgi:hypothetical protein
LKPPPTNNPNCPLYRGKISLGIGGVAGLAAQVEIEEPMILGRCGKRFASKMVALFQGQIVQGQTVGGSGTT